MSCFLRSHPRLLGVFIFLFLFVFIETYDFLRLSFFFFRFFLFLFGLFFFTDINPSVMWGRDLSYVFFASPSARSALYFWIVFFFFFSPPSPPPPPPHILSPYLSSHNGFFLSFLVKIPVFLAPSPFPSCFGGFVLLSAFNIPSCCFFFAVRF